MQHAEKTFFNEAGFLTNNLSAYAKSLAFNGMKHFFGD
jgi:hypothetical protein